MGTNVVILRALEENGASSTNILTGKGGTLENLKWRQKRKFTQAERVQERSLVLVSGFFGSLVTTNSNGKQQYDMGLRGKEEKQMQTIGRFYYGKQHTSTENTNHKFFIIG